MSVCSDCGKYFRNSPYNKSNVCDDCYGHKPAVPDPEDREDLDLFLNYKEGSSKTSPVFYD